MIRLRCTCKVMYGIPEEYAGKRLRCKHCGTLVRVPTREEAKVLGSGGHAAPVQVAAPPSPPGPAHSSTPPREDVAPLDVEATTGAAEVAAVDGVLAVREGGGAAASEPQPAPSPTVSQTTSSGAARPSRNIDPQDLAPEDGPQPATSNGNQRQSPASQAPTKQTARTSSELHIIQDPTCHSSNNSPSRKREKRIRKVHLLTIGFVALCLFTAGFLWHIATKREPMPKFELPGFTFLRTNPQGYHEYTHDLTQIVFVLLPGGHFTMGEPDEVVFAENKRALLEMAAESGKVYDNDEIQARCNQAVLLTKEHTVLLSSFLIAKFEVTQEQWEHVMGTNPSRNKGAEYPVDSVSWMDCVSFLKKAGLKMPSEAQWEYACRGGTTREYSGPLNEVAWYGDNSGCRSHPVGQKKPNGFGLHDMHGNIAEWCMDVYNWMFYGTPEATHIDPVNLNGIFTTANRILRGGHFLSIDIGCASSDRWGGGVHEAEYTYGLRPSSPCVPQELIDHLEKASTWLQRELEDPKR